jgi:hypothetical protein
MKKRGKSQVDWADPQARLHQLVRDARIGLARYAPPREDPITAEEAERVQTAIATLSSSERLVIVRTYGIGSPPATTLTAIEQEQGWSKGRASETRRRALGKLHDAVYVPPLPPLGAWVRIEAAKLESGGTIAGVRVLEHKGRYEFIGGVMMLFNEQQPYWRVIEERRCYCSVRDYSPLSPHAALQYALRIDKREAQLRAEVLVDLAPHLETDNASYAFREGLADAIKLHQNDAAPILAAMLEEPNLPADIRLWVLQALLPMIPQMGDSWAQMRVVYKIVPRLKPDEYAALVAGVHKAQQGPFGHRSYEDLLVMIARATERRDNPGVGNNRDI